MNRPLATLAVAAALLGGAAVADARTIPGTSGADTLIGTSGADLIKGGRGNDRIDGGRGDDTLLGGAGRDRVKGGPGRDTLSGGNGNDRIDARDRRADKTVLCGDGHDVVYADRQDPLRDCEDVRR